MPAGDRGSGAESTGPGTLFVVSGPSGVGKGTIVRALRARRPDVVWSVSWATRAPREGEVDGVDYHFVSRDEFERERSEGGFLESFDVYGDLKGTPRRPVLEHLAGGRDVLLEVDVQGALAVREAHPEAVLVFVRAPSRAVQRERLEERAGDDPAQRAALERRLAAAEGEERLAGRFDHVVVNDELERAVGEVAAILDRHRRASPPAPRPPGRPGEPPPEPPGEQGGEQGGAGGG